MLGINPLERREKKRDLVKNEVREEAKQIFFEGKKLLSIFHKMKQS